MIVPTRPLQPKSIKPVPMRKVLNQDGSSVLNKNGIEVYEKIDHLCGDGCGRTIQNEDAEYSDIMCDEWHCWDCHVEHYEQQGIATMHLTDLGIPL